MPTFFPALEGTPTSVMKVTASAFASPLETVAPGVTSLIDGTQAVGETWAQTLIRLLPSISGTDEQRKILMDQAIRAQSGLDPLPAPIDPETAQTPAWLKFGGLAALGLMLFS